MNILYFVLFFFFLPVRGCRVFDGQFLDASVRLVCLLRSLLASLVLCRRRRRRPFLSVTHLTPLFCCCCCCFLYPLFVCFYYVASSLARLFHPRLYLSSTDPFVYIPLPSTLGLFPLYLFARTQPLPPKMLSLFPVLDAFRNISRCCCCTALYSFPPFLSFFLFASRQSPSFTYLPRPPTHICITQQQSIFFYRSLRPDMCLLPFPSSFLFAFAFALSYASPSPHLPHSLAMSSCGAFWYLLVGVLVIPLLLLVGTASLIFYFHFFMRVTDAKWGRLDSFSSCYLSIAFLRGFESCVSLSFFLSIFFFFFLLSVCVIVAF